MKKLKLTSNMHAVLDVCFADEKCATVTLTPTLDGLPAWDVCRHAVPKRGPLCGRGVATKNLERDRVFGWAAGPAAVGPFAAACQVVSSPVCVRTMAILHTSFDSLADMHTSLVPHTRSIELLVVLVSDWNNIAWKRSRSFDKVPTHDWTESACRLGAVVCGGSCTSGSEPGVSPTRFGEVSPRGAARAFNLEIFGVGKHTDAANAPCARSQKLVSKGSRVAGRLGIFAERVQARAV